MSERNKTIFLTGATGLIGSYLLTLLLEYGYEVYCLARSKKNESARQRIMNLLNFWKGDSWTDTPGNLKIIEGDIRLPDLGIKDKKRYAALAEKIDIIYHSAALAELKVPIDKIRKINVDGTKNVFDFAVRCASAGALQKINHISTAYVVGDKNGIDFTEDMLDVGQSFYNTYEQSKYEAELLVNEYIERDGLPVAIFRPSMVMGESQEGKTTNFRLIYEPLHFFSQGIFEVFPADPDCSQNLICLDSVAKALFLLGLNECTGTYHLVSPNNVNIDIFMKSASDYFGFQIPELCSVKEFEFSRWSPIQKMLAEPFIPYFNYRTRFMSKKTADALRKAGGIVPEIDGRKMLSIFSFCIKSGYIKKYNNDRF